MALLVHCTENNCPGHGAFEEKCPEPFAPKPVPSLQELAEKICQFNELPELDGMSMLSKAGALAQIAQAQALERIATALEKITRCIDTDADAIRNEPV